MTVLADLPQTWREEAGCSGQTKCRECQHVDQCAADLTAALDTLRAQIEQLPTYRAGDYTGDLTIKRADVLKLLTPSASKPEETP